MYKAREWRHGLYNGHQLNKEVHHEKNQQRGNYSMRKNSYQNKWDCDVIYCEGTSIPLISTIEFMMFENIKRKIDEKGTNILSMDEIFEGYTHTRKLRFELLSRLSKKKFIKRVRIDSNYHSYEILMNESFRDSKGMRIYKPATRRERLELIKEFNAK